MPTYLDFEKPIAELEGKIEELRHLTDGGDINIAEEVGKLQQKADRLLRQTYGKLGAWQKTQVARHPDRPHSVDYIGALIEDFTPLAGDRAFADDRAIIGGLGRFRGRSRRGHRPREGRRHRHPHAAQFRHGAARGLSQGAAPHGPRRPLPPAGA